MKKSRTSRTKFLIERWDGLMTCTAGVARSIHWGTSRVKWSPWNTEASSPTPSNSIIPNTLGHLRVINTMIDIAYDPAASWCVIICVHRASWTQQNSSRGDQRRRSPCWKALSRAVSALHSPLAASFLIPDLVNRAARRLSYLVSLSVNVMELLLQLIDV